MKILDIKSLVKIYRSPFLMKKSVGLDGLDLEIEKGEIYGLLGPNGAGKTTALKIITGLLKKTSGEIRLFGKLSPLQARKQIGFLPENPSFYPHLTGGELLSFYAKLYNKYLSTNEINKNLAMVGLNESINKRLDGYSKGMVQRIGFAQSIIGDPDFIILDEPLSGLDPLGRREIKDLIVEINRKGKTVMFSSHILSDVEAICSRVGIIINGKMKQVGNLRNILRRDIKFVEIEFEGINNLKNFSKFGEIRTESGVNFLRIKSEKTRDKAIKEITKKNGKILSVAPVKSTLEEHFMRAINE
ncbi:ABC transporter ATP-binding protein [candidate division WOR-3 bacterium]|nr:ABC transporter ATP-binding protein [candidate division WOR-3 bacterium]